MQVTYNGVDYQIPDNTPFTIAGLEFVGDGYSKTEAIALGQGSWNEKNIKNFLKLLELISSSPASVASVPVGTILAFAGTTAPNGFIFCHGLWFAKTEQPALYAVIGGSFGVSELSFRTPDLRGEFIRGYSAGRTDLDANRVFGSVQTGSGSHSHTVDVATTKVVADASGVSVAVSATTRGSYSSSAAPHNVALNYIIKV